MIEVEYTHFATPKELMNLGNPYVLLMEINNTVNKVFFPKL